MIEFILILLCILLLYNTTIKEKFDQRANSAFAQYKPLSAFIAAVRSLENKEYKYRNIRHNTLSIFNDFVENKLFKLKQTNIRAYRIKDILARIEKKIPSYSIIFLDSNNYSAYTYKYLKDVLFLKIDCKIIDRNLQTSNYLEQGEIKFTPIILYLAMYKDILLYSSVNGYRNEKDILRYSDPKSNNYYYSAQMFNSNLDKPNEFGGYALLTPDLDALKKFCENRRKEINNFSYCKLNKVKKDGSVEPVFDQNIDEIKCIEQEGEIYRTNTPQFNLLFDNPNLIAEDINGNIEINDIYLPESDPCADLSKFDSNFNNIFEQQRQFNKINSF